ncbi:hypothetical protein [Streptomyces sp. A0592]|uniref:hypothetical protein n=1 Tax=Streptomyces sp. A0592 TaxID=2563099 RepID=UPI00109E8EFC|nr:hypothetical protein [Streptomyces sp. A0592]THA81203.1 hypothetical protein E6U81_25535 [Streptomyces sp. A0592]
MAKIDPIARAAAMSARGLILKAPYPGADKPWPAICKTCMQPTKSSYTSVITKGQGPCFTCGQRKSSAAAARKRAVPAEVAEDKIREANVKPLETFPGTQGAWRGLCLTCLREIDVWYCSVVYSGNGACYYCSGTRQIPDADARAELLTLGLEALVPYPGSNEKWRSRCTTCKKIVDPTLCNARKTKSPCRFCAQRATDPEVAVETMKEAGLRPLTAFPGNVKAVWRAEHIDCGKQVDAVLDKVIQRRRASCIHCVQYGFKQALPAFLYLLVHTALGAAKIGICNDGSGRIRTHELNGWRQVLVTPLSGYQAVRAEQHVLNHWLALDLPQGVSRLDMPQGGWTETVALRDRSLPELREAFDAAVASAVRPRCSGSATDPSPSEEDGYLF